MVHKILGQASGTVVGSPTTLYTLPSSTRVFNMTMAIACGSSASAYTIWQEDDGTAAAATNVIHDAIAITANTTVRIPIGPMATAGADIYVACTVAADIVFTLYGTEELIS